MSVLEFHKCRSCGRIFYSGNKTTYCSVCVPRLVSAVPTEAIKIYRDAIVNAKTLQEKKALERLRWRTRMADPKFREHERLRSLARYKAERKYAKKEGR